MSWPKSNVVSSDCGVLDRLFQNATINVRIHLGDVQRSGFHAHARLNETKMSICGKCRADPSRVKRGSHDLD